VSSSDTNIIKIVESATKLGLYQWIGRRFHFSCYTVRLEAINSSSNEINIISPSSNNRISLNGNTWSFGICKGFFKSLPSIGVCNFIAFSSFLGDISGQVFAMFTLTVAAAEAAIGLAILVVFFRNLGSIEVEKIRKLKG